MRVRLWLARGLIGFVLFWNVQSAFALLLHPQAFAPAFELSGEPGRAAVQGTAILFLMWNVPYAVALLHPIRHRISVLEAVCMQAIGVIGESILRSSLPAEQFILSRSLERFLIFDAVGLAALIIALILVWRPQHQPAPEQAPA